MTPEPARPASGDTPVGPPAPPTRQDALTAGHACYYADGTRRPARPDCEGFAVVAYGPIALCAACDKTRSAVGRSHVGRPLPGAQLHRLLGAARALAGAERDVADAVRLARQAGASWGHIGHALGVTRQAAQQRWARPADAG